MTILRFFILLMLLSLPAFAQDAGDGTKDGKGEVTKQPVCFRIENKAPYTVFGTIITNNMEGNGGIQGRHRANFRLEKENYAEFCSSGPFYPGRKLDVQLRTLVPIFECRTALTGPLVIHGERGKDGTKTWIDCIK